MKLDDIDMWLALMLVAVTFLSGIVFLWLGIASTFGSVVAYFSAAAGLLGMSIVIALEIRR